MFFILLPFMFFKILILLPPVLILREMENYRKTAKLFLIFLQHEILTLFLTLKPSNNVTTQFLLFVWKQTKLTNFTEVWKYCKKQSDLVGVLSVPGIVLALCLQYKNICRNEKVLVLCSLLIFFTSFLLNVSFSDLFKVVQELQDCISW